MCPRALKKEKNVLCKFSTKAILFLVIHAILLVVIYEIIFIMAMLLLIISIRKV